MRRNGHGSLCVIANYMRERSYGLTVAYQGKRLRRDERRPDLRNLATQGLAFGF